MARAVFVLPRSKRSLYRCSDCCSPPFLSTSNTMNRTATSLAAAFCLAFPAIEAQPARSDSAAAVGAVEQFHAALSAADSARAISWLTEDVMILESGNIQTRADYLGGHLGADIKASQGSKAERTVVKVTVTGDVAVVVSRSITPATGAQGSTASEMAELVVLSRTAGGWKIRAIHWSSRRRRA